MPADAGTPRTAPTDDAGRQALLAAVRSVEAKSAAEVVIVLRAQSGSYLQADVTAGAIAAYLALWFQLFSPWEYPLIAIQVAPAVVGLAAALLTRTLPGVRRALTPPRVRREQVRTHARAEFHDSGVSATRGRTGLLVYLSTLERAAEVVADTGVLAAVDKTAWSAAVAAVEQAAGARRADAAAIASAIASLGDVLEWALPRGADDVDELPDAIG